MNAIRLIVATLLVAFLSACSTYQLRGYVFYGSRSKVEWIDADDPRLPKGSPVEEAVVILTLDPNEIRNKYLGEVYPDSSGAFSMKIDEPGAGMLEYEIGVIASAPGYSDAQDALPLAGSGKRLLITLAPGRGRAVNPDRLLDEFERNKDQFK